ncbi:ABC transporter permease [Tessaracoccus rhinocerotis]|uniref:ABC transporter permease n=1 Tax=Tessaracoccus rhinocerotis TaxID=1689449 RepID=A0A553K5W8_9ACTN|nr:ABC transporter permease [Tessaracoccus rhinocerotis]TRY20103.1 ABC transporter permease [Tessaracoccus rhinocerotis]
MSDNGTGPAGFLKEVVRRQYFWGVVAIVLLLLVNLTKDPSYLSIGWNDANGALVGNLVDILRAAAPIMMISIGMCLVIATSGIDLSVGSVMVIAGAVSMQFLAAAPNTFAGAMAALGLALLVSAVVGLVNGILVSVVGLQPFISTLIMMLAGRGIAKVITGGQNTSAVNDSFRWIANGYLFGLPVVFLLALAIVVLVGLLVRRSALGLMIEAIGMDPQAARLAGVNRRGLLLAVYSISGLLSGVAGVFATASVMTVDISRTGYQLEMDAILAVVIGGTSLAGGKFNLTGATVGALLIATLDKTVVFLGVSSSATPAFKAVVIVVLCLIQSDRVRQLLRSRRTTGSRPSRKEAVAA